jgi:hypothetical protein
MRSKQNNHEEQKQLSAELTYRLELLRSLLIEISALIA